MKVAIAGYGIEGESNYLYYAALGHDVTIVDERETPKYPVPEGAKTMLGEGKLTELTGFDLVVRTAGLSPNKIVTDGKVWSATNEFFAKCPAPIIGVTGTKGKGTTSSLITEILRASGKKVHLVGNIGLAALDVLADITDDDVVVYEMSSFQLWDLEKSPHVAVVLMIEPDHLDVHVDMDEYLDAKSHIVRYQQPEDITIYHPTNELSARVATQGDGKKVRFGISDDDQVYVRDGAFCVRDEIICATDALQIPGAHNLDNACAAISAARVFLESTAAVEAGLRAFTGLPHRLKFVGEANGVKYYDDSIATTPGSAIAAMRAFDQPKILILGGSDKGADYGEIVDVCKQTNTRVVSIGQTGNRIAELCRERDVEVIRVEGTMEKVVPVCARIAASGDVVILSPASASFDQYNNYSDRGDKFAAAVGEL